MDGRALAQLDEGSQEVTHRRATRWRRCMALCALMAAAPALATSDRDDDRILRIRGVAVTGINDLCGRSVWTFDFPPPLPADFRTPVVGIFDPHPGATDAIPLTPRNCSPNAVLATTVDPFFSQYLGVDPQTVDDRLKNVPLRSVPTPASFTGVRAPLPPLAAVPAETSVQTPTRAEPNDPITLGKWLSVRSELVIRCKLDGTATARARFSNLIPNGMYTLWGAWNTRPAGLPQAVLIPIPFGGAPNTIVPDEHGNASFSRQFAACPLDAPPDGSKLLFVVLVYQSDGVAGGALPGAFHQPLQFQAADGSVFTSRAVPGVVLQDNVIFPIAGTRR